MQTQVHIDDADDRLADLDLSLDVLTNVALRADAEARMVSDLEPPTAEGVTRYNKMVGFLRQAVLPSGWVTDDSKNYCRTINPERGIAIVVSSGDEFVGIVGNGAVPSTKYVKGETTTQAVEANEQLMLDLGAGFEVADETDPLSGVIVWILLHRVEADGIVMELSLPSEVKGGRIVGWAERIILGKVFHTPEPLPHDSYDDGSTYDVDVAMR